MCMAEGTLVSSRPAHWRSLQSPPPYTSLDSAFPIDTSPLKSFVYTFSLLLLHLPFLGLLGSGLDFRGNISSHCVPFICILSLNVWIFLSEMLMSACFPFAHCSVLVISSFISQVGTEWTAWEHFMSPTWWPLPDLSSFLSIHPIRLHISDTSIKEEFLEQDIIMTLI